MPLTDPDESFYAETAKEMLRADEWITPRIFGEPQFEKPVLYYWLIQISYRIFGVSEFSARLPSAVFGIMGIIGIYFLGRALFSPLCGFLSGLAAATSIQYIVLARACVTDMVLTVCILYSLVFFVYAWRGGGRKYFYFSALAAALATLTKGPVGVLIPGAVMLIYILSSGQWRELKKVPFFPSLAVFLAAALPWYVLVTRIHGGTFISEFFGFQNVTRFLVPEHRIGSSPFFYIPVVFGGVFPWTSFLIFGAWRMFRDREFASLFKAARAFLAIWFLFILIFFSAARTKLVTYIFPLFPVIVLIPGWFWARFMEPAGGDERSKKLLNYSYLFLIALNVGGSITAAAVIKYRYDWFFAETLLACGIFVFGALVSYLFFLKKRPAPAFISLVALVIVLVVPLGLWISPELGALESSKTLSFILVDLAGPDEPIGGECDRRRGIAFYTGREDIVDIHPYPDLIKFMEKKTRVWGIIQSKHYRQLIEHRTDLYVLPVAESGKYVLITNQSIINK